MGSMKSTKYGGTIGVFSDFGTALAACGAAIGKEIYHHVCLRNVSFVVPRLIILFN